MVFTVLAVLLLDRVGRRALLLIGTAGLTVALALLGVFFAWSPRMQHAAPWLALVALHRCSSRRSRSVSGRCSG